MGKVTVDTTYHQEVGPIPDGLYAVEVIRRTDGKDNPEVRKTQNNKNQLMWTLKIIMTEPGKEAQKNRTINYFTLNHSDKEQDQTWPTVRMLRALKISIGKERKTFDTSILLGRRCGVTIVVEEDREGKPRSNVRSVMSLEDFGKAMAEIRNEHERTRQAVGDTEDAPEPEEDDETEEETEEDADSEELAAV